jgi:plasmid stabilization system protein ParE
VTLRVSYTSATERDIDEALSYLFHESQAAAALIAERLFVLESRLAEVPLMYPVMVRSIRGAWLHPFRYIVYYRATDDEVIVMARLRTSRSPRATRRILRQR